MAKIISLILFLTLFNILANSKQTCKQVCQKLQDKDCVICFKKCVATSENKRYESFELESCKRKVCLQEREMYHIDEDGTQIKQQYCYRKGYSHIAEDICLLQCCDTHEYTKFTEARLQKCIEKSKNQTKNSKFQLSEKDKEDIVYGFWGIAIILISLCLCCCGCCAGK